MSDAPSPPVDRGFRFRRLWPLVALGIGFAAVFAFGLDHYVSFDVLRAHRAELVAFVESKRVIAGALFVVFYVVVTALSIPGATVLTLAGGFLFGTLLGGILVAVAATLGSTIVYAAVKTSLGDHLRARAGPAIKAMESGFRANAISYMLFLRLVPAFPFFVVNLAPAVLGVQPPIFIVATALGILPATFIYASVGSGLGRVFDAGKVPDLGLIFSGEFLWPLVGLALLALAPVVYKRLARRRWPK